MNAKPSDEQLVAYLDDQLDTEQRARIDAAIAEDPMLGLRLQWLDRSSLPFKEAYRRIGSAGARGSPASDARHLALAGPSSAQPSLVPGGGGRAGGRRRAGGSFVPGLAGSQQTSNWRGLVADYMALYVPQTLDHLPSDEATQRAQLRTIDARLGLNLSPAQLSLPRTELKRAQILEYDGVPIAQITYLDPVHGPMALCITRSNSGSRHFAQERRHGMNMVYWSDMRPRLDADRA